MSINQLSPEARQTLAALAEINHKSPEEMLREMAQPFTGRMVTRHQMSLKLIGQKQRFN